MSLQGGQEKAFSPEKTGPEFFIEGNGDLGTQGRT